MTRRVLDYMLFMNSKVLFKHLRHDQGRFASHTPVMVHVNYHPGKDWGWGLLFGRAEAAWEGLLFWMAATAGGGLSCDCDTQRTSGRAVR